MIESLIHTTENNNSYMYDDQHRLSMLIHPELRKIPEKSTDVDPYYQEKYAYLRQHGFFSKSGPAKFETLNEELVKKSIIQTSKIIFEVTDSCNLNCTYCTYGELYEGYDTRNCKNINIRNAKKLLKYTFDHESRINSSRQLIGFYGGEPLMNISFIKKIVEIANQLKSEKELDIDFSMTTNATLIHKHIDFLVANKFLLFISLDGNEENHSYRVFSKNKKNSFRKVIENIDMIQRDYPDYFANYVQINTVLHDRNSVKDIYEFIYTRYHKIPEISELAIDDIKPDKEVILRKMYRNRGKSEYEYQKEESNLLPATDNNAIYLELIDFLGYFSINFYISNITALLDTEEKHYPTSTCVPFAKEIFLTTCDKLLPCETINYKYSMGKVNNNVFIDVPEITRQYNQYYDRLKKVCQYCYAYKYCGICMFHLKNLDKLDSEEFVCDSFYDQKDFRDKLYRIFSFLENYQIEIPNVFKNMISEQ